MRLWLRPGQVRTVAQRVFCAVWGFEVKPGPRAEVPEKHCLCNAQRGAAGYPVRRCRDCALLHRPGTSTTHRAFTTAITGFAATGGVVARVASCASHGVAALELSLAPYFLQPLHDFYHAVTMQLHLLWKATGLGPWLMLFWTALSPYPPFSWLQWLVLKVWHLPLLYRSYIMFLFVDNVWKWLLPSFHSEVVVGAWLALLYRFNPKAYVQRVVNRLVSMLNKQAKLLSPKGELLETLCTRLRNDAQLLQVLGHHRTLRVWPKLRRQTLGSLSFSSPREAWLLKTIVDGYYREVEAEVKEATLVAAAQQAAAKMRALHEAMDSARLASKDGGLSQGTGGLMTEVDVASAQAADAIIALGQAKVEAQEATARVGKAGLASCY
eukprot:g17707.t1